MESITRVVLQSIIQYSTLYFNYIKTRPCNMYIMYIYDITYIKIMTFI